MKNDEILEAARKNKNRGKEYESKILIRGDMLALAVSILVGVVLFIIKYFATNTVDIGLIAVGTCASGVQSLHEGIKLKKWYYIISGIFLLIICCCTIILYIGKSVLR